MPFGDRFYFSRNGGIGGGRLVHPKDTMAASGVGYRNNMGGNGRAIFVPFGMNGVRITLMSSVAYKCPDILGQSYQCP